MKACPRCKAPGTDVAAFCPNCGSSFGTGKRSYLLALGIGAAVLLAAFATVRLAGVLRTEKSSANSVLAATDTTTGQAVLSAPSSQSPPVLPAEGMRMPEEVRRWLEHLKAIDNRRADYNKQASGTLMQKLTSGILSAGIVETEDEALADEAKRQGVAKDLTSETNAFFLRLSADFNAFQPPTECSLIASRYNEILSGTQSMLLDVIGAIEEVSLERLQGLRGQSLKRIDNPAQECNTAIAAICAKYHEPNRYDVLVERGSVLNVDGLLLGTGIGAPSAPKDDSGG